MENGNLSQGEGKDPSAFLSEIIGNSVTVKLNSGVVYKGVFELFKPAAFADILSAGELQSIDGYMNLALEKCEEYVDGVKKRSYGDAFVRGNNGTAPCFGESAFTDVRLHSHVYLGRLRRS
jgi:U6 snRNA-associated Sm-like protein LSm6